MCYYNLPNSSDLDLCVYAPMYFIYLHAYIYLQHAFKMRTISDIEYLLWHTVNVVIKPIKVNSENLGGICCFKYNMLVGNFSKGQIVF